jgi:hypothetical protein
LFLKLLIVPHSGRYFFTDPRFRFLSLFVSQQVLGSVADCTFYAFPHGVGISFFSVEKWSKSTTYLNLVLPSGGLILEFEDLISFWIVGFCFRFEFQFDVCHHKLVV